MRIIGLLSWFDEPQANLVTAITTMVERLGVDHVVAVDGRYDLYQAEKDVSGPTDWGTIVMVTGQLGAGLTLHVPTAPWAGGEVEKRTKLFALGWSVAEPGDWFFVQDADCAVLEAPEDLRARLALVPDDVVEVMVQDEVARELRLDQFPDHWEYRALFRAQPIIVSEHHGTYVAADGRVLWASRQDRDQVPCTDMSDAILIDHRPQANRSALRQLGKQNYYAERDGSGVEFGTCGCGSKATRKLHCRWRMYRGKLVGEIREVCESCAVKQLAMDARRLRIMGVDPDSVVSSEHYGALPMSGR